MDMLKQVGAIASSVVLVSAGVLGGAVFLDDGGDKIDKLESDILSLKSSNDDLKSELKDSKTPVVNKTVVTLDSLNDDVDSIKAKIFEEDAFEAESEVVALDEVERRDYKELFEFLEVTFEDVVDKEDINKVVVKDKTTTITDLDDKDATVEYELKVYYEDKDGDDVKKYITATVVVEDGEVESLDFEETA